MSDNNIKLIEQKLLLNQVSFIRKEDKKGTFQVLVKDEIKNLIITEEDISFTYSRRAGLVPEVLFEVIVEFEYSARFDSESMKIMKERQNSLDAEHIQRIINNTTMAQTASVIISNLTIINGGNPLITPPNFCK